MPGFFLLKAGKKPIDKDIEIVYWLFKQTINSGVAMMGRPSVTKERKLQIAKGFMTVMASKGYDGASMPAVAKAAGLGQGLIHYHFKNKEEILIAVLGELVKAHMDSLEKRLAGCGTDPEKQLNEFIDFHLGLGAHADPDALACWVIISGEALKKPKVRAHYEKAIKGYIQGLSEIISNGVAAGRFRCGSIQAAASALMATTQGYFVLAAAARSQIPRGTAAGCTKEMAKGLLKSPAHDQGER
jgi:TetR/AcrR family transcriptional repressor of bet genes